MKTMETTLPTSRFIPLMTASEITGVAYDTMITANRAGRLSLTKDEEGYLHIDVIDLIIYMIKGAPKKQRWKPTNIPLATLATDPKFQSRTTDTGSVVAKLEDHFRVGGAVEPVWVLPLEGKLFLLDGHRRRKAAIQAERQNISAVEVKLPIEYAQIISLLVNRRHGENLSATDQRGIVIKFLEENPKVAKAIEDGNLTQAALSHALDIPAATVSRAIRDTKSPEELAVVPTQSVLGDLHVLLGHLTERRLPTEEIAVGVIALRCASEALTRNFSINQVRAAKSAATNGLGFIAGHLTPQLKQMLDRRGGDRRRLRKSE